MGRITNLMIVIAAAAAIYTIVSFPEIISFVENSIKLDVSPEAVRNISFAIAFLAGVASLFSPCTIAVLPAFVSFAFKEKRDVAKITGVFFLGFSLSFVTLGILIAYLGKISYVFFQNTSTALIQGIGFLLIAFGVMTFFGKGFRFLNFGIKPRHDFAGVFLFGAVFAVGWSACSGPIISGILTVAAAFNNYAYSALLLFFYSLGIMIPLFILALAYDRYNLAESRLIKGYELKLTVFGRKLSVHSSSAFAGLLLIALGLLFLINKGTTNLTAADLFGRLIVLSCLLIAAYVIHRYAARLLPEGNARRAALAIMLIAAVFLYLYLDSRFIISTVGYAEFLDRVILYNPALFNVVGIMLLAAFAFAFWWMAIKNR
ncbi:cytochrome c biogenesis protein CcdA [Candidatus Woesearchaeota archaeon]|nr:cytochrome c biogenesis protein CcdA [Candidatus Woesearchaeota archaeon]